MNTKISRISVFYIFALLILGIVGYFATGRESVTALIPAFFGLFVFLVWLIQRRYAASRVALWTLVVTGFIGFLATVNGLPGFLDVLQGEQVARPAAAISKAIMAITSLAYSIVCSLLVKK